MTHMLFNRELGVTVLSSFCSDPTFLISSRHVATSLKSLMKGVQTSGDVDEDELDDAVCYATIVIPSSDAD
jgi:hypothetical protein